MPLDATVGGATANSYVTVAVASELLLGRLYTDAWYGTESVPVSIATREQALIWATSLLETQVRWDGTPTTTTQALAWPMTGQVDHLGRPMPETVVPVVIQQATALYALALLQDTSQDPASLAEAGIQSKKIGDTTITFRDSGMPVSPIHEIPAEVRALLMPYATMKTAGGIFTVALMRT